MDLSMLVKVDVKHLEMVLRHFWKYYLLVAKTTNVVSLLPVELCRCEVQGNGEKAKPRAGVSGQRGHRWEFTAH